MFVINELPMETNLKNISQTIYRKFGFFNCYKGLSTILLGCFPYGAFKFYYFELFKNIVLQHKKKENLNQIEALLCGASSGIIAATLTYPLEMIRK